MLSLFHAQLYRLVRTRATWIALALVLFVEAVSAVATSADWATSETFLDVLMRFSVLIWVSVCVPLYLAWFVTQDFKTGAVGALLVSPRSRLQYAGAIALVGALAVAVVLLAAMGIAGALWQLADLGSVSFSLGATALWYLFALLICWAYVVLCLVCAPFGNEVLSLTVGALLVSSLALAPIAMLPWPIGGGYFMIRYSTTRSHMCVLLSDLALPWREHGSSTSSLWGRLHGLSSPLSCAARG